MQTKPQRSSRTGQRDSGAKAPLYTEQVIWWAVDAYEEALKLDPANVQAKSGFESVKRAIEAEARADGVDPGNALGNMFSDPQMIQKLANNPKTSSYLADSAFMAKLQRLKDDPNSMSEALGDPRLLQVMSVLLGIDMSFAAPGQSGNAQTGASNQFQPGQFLFRIRLPFSPMM